MSSAAASLNQSTESAISSGQRSGLNISVGDTKSIVLALQALQSKIRALENDKNYHQDQYEQTMKSHEVYKQNMQRQVELERAAHHKRERELLDELRKAQEENAKLQSAINGRRDRETSDLSKLRAEIELAVAQEKRSAAEREDKLRSEIDRLRNEIDAQKRKESEIRATLESLRAERDGVEQTNVQLRRAMDELLSTFEKEKERVEYGSNNNKNRQHRQQESEEEQQQQEEYYVMKPTRAVSARAVDDRTRSISASRMQHTRAATPRSNMHPLYSKPRSLSKGNYSELTWSSYRDPTCNSMLRDVRNVNGVGICRTHTPPIQRSNRAHEVEISNARSTRENYNTNEKNNSGKLKMNLVNKRVNEHSLLHPQINKVLERGNVYSNVVNHYSQNKVLKRENSRLQRLNGEEQNRHRVHLPESTNREQINKENKSYSRAQNYGENNVNSNFVNGALQSTGFEAVNTVEAQLRSELNELHAQYRDTVERGAAEQIPNDVLTGALSHISRLIDHKVEQLRLINDAQRELSVISTSCGKSFASSEREANAIDKTTQRTLLMNEIREMLAKTAKVV